MPGSNHPSHRPPPPAWALTQARAELPDTDDAQARTDRAWHLVREANQRHLERHDEFDDPDQGGES